MIKEYLEYVKDNPEGYWFKRALYGWGWTPAKWQGWAVIAAYILVLLYIALDIGVDTHSAGNILTRIPGPSIVATAILIYLCYKKGESPSWQWGTPKK